MLEESEEPGEKRRIRMNDHCPAIRRRWESDSCCSDNERGTYPFTIQVPDSGSIYDSKLQSDTFVTYWER